MFGATHLTYNKLPQISISDLNPELAAKVSDQDYYVQLACRKMVACVVMFKDVDPIEVGIRDILSVEVESTFYSFGQNRPSHLIPNARKVCRLLGNTKLFPDHRYISCHPLLSKWLDSVPASRKKPSKSHSMYFLSWIVSNDIQGYEAHTVPIWLISRSTLLRYRLYLLRRVTNNEISRPTVSSYLNCVGSWLSWLYKQGVIPHVDTKHLSVGYATEYTRVVPSHQEVRNFLETIILNKEFHNMFLYFLVEIATGARPNEIIKLTWLDVNFNDHTLRLQSKNGHPRWIPLPNEVWRLFVKSMKGRDTKKQESVFTQSNGMPFGYDQVRRQFAKVLNYAKLNIDGQMAYRHRFATDCLEANVSIATTIYLLGQKDTSNLVRYQHPKRSSTKAAVNETFDNISWGHEMDDCR